MLPHVLATFQSTVSKIFHGSAFVKIFSNLNIPDDLIKNTNHLEKLGCSKNKKTSTISFPI